jgi:2'-5' RNA ligase
MRLFVAIEIESDIRDRMEAFMQQWKTKISNARWVRPQGLHITLKFLGNVKDERRAGIEQALRQIHAPRFQISVQGIGVFPNPKSPRVLWVGIRADDGLASLAAQVDQQMVCNGFEPEKRAFSPHVTLARLKERSGKSEIEKALSVPESNFGTMTARAFHLYESNVSPQGSIYKQLNTFELIS